VSTDDTRSRLLDAAGAEFADHGFERATVRDICRRAGVNLASVNYYFGDKERLYVETVKEAQRMRSEQVPAPQWDADVPPQQKLRDFIGMLLHRMLRARTAPWHARLMMREVLKPTQACRELAEEFFRPQFELLQQIVTELIPPGSEPHVVQQIAFSIVGQCLFYRVAGEIVEFLIDDATRHEHYQIEQLADHITRMSLASLGAGPPLVGNRLGNAIKSSGNSIESLSGK
jgi:AcrR family transcriptional regulator